MPKNTNIDKLSLIFTKEVQNEIQTGRDATETLRNSGLTF